jgi:hypothetical protein
MLRRTRKRSARRQRQRQRQPFRKTRRIGPQGCHPRVGEKRPSAGCFPSAIRAHLTRKRHKSLKEEGGRQKGSGGTSMCKNHNEDRCLLHNSTLPDSEKETLARKYLRPARPSAWLDDPDQWLDSNNIADVMKQYEETYKDFKFLGVMPIDFAAPDPYNKSKEKCLIDKICELNLAALSKSGIHRLGAIFNLDPHFKDGSHWVACFVDLNKEKVYYFDSYGIKPPEQIAKFMRSLTLQDPNLELEFNGRRFQFQGSECGMYSLYFIISMLEGANFKEFCQHAVPDGEMLRLRHWFFS